MRAQWAIENNLHWSLDVSFRENFNRTRTAFAAKNLRKPPARQQFP
jgi:predicted transposase YbfD/YdcC